MTDGAVVLAERRLQEGELDRLVREVTAAWNAPAARLVPVGRRLRDWLDRTGDGRWSRELAAVGAAGLTLVVEAGAGLEDLPWELLADEDGPLAADADRPFCPLRLVERPGAALGPAPSDRPLRLLFMASSPADMVPVLDFEAEEEAIAAVTRDSGIELVVEERGSLAGLRDRLEDTAPEWFDVIHLTGHAGIDERLGPVLYLEGATGGVARVEPEWLARAVDGRWPRLLFVSGCSTAQSPAPLAPSFAERLIEAGAPCVLAWARPVSDRFTTTFVADLYDRLAAGADVESAVAEARAALLAREAAAGRCHDWLLMQVYAAAPAVGPLVTGAGTIGGAEAGGALAPAPVEPDATHDGDGDEPAAEPEGDFVGRRREIQRALALLTGPGERGDGDAEGLVVHGMGGVGKSSLVARLRERLGGHRHLVRVGVLDRPALQGVVADELGARAAAGLGDPSIPLERGLRDLLAAAPAPLLFVFDGFEANLDTSGRGGLAFDEHGRVRVRSAASEVVAALVRAIRARTSSSRVLVACRYPPALDPAPARLVLFGLGGLHRADVDKLIAQLPSIGSREPHDPVRVRALEVAGGNPGLLHRIDEALAPAAPAGPGVDAALARVDAAVTSFRTTIDADALLRGLPEGARAVLGALRTCLLAVERDAAVAIGGRAAADLDRVAGTALVEVSADRAGTGDAYRVAPVVRDLAAPLLGPHERAAATARAFTHLWRAWGVETKSGVGEDRALELIRLGLGTDQPGRVVALAFLVLSQFVTKESRFNHAVQVATRVLDVVDHAGVRHLLGRAQYHLGYTAEALANQWRALRTCPTEDIRLRGAIFAALADLEARQGDMTQALDHYQQSLDCFARLGDTRNQGAALHQMAVLVAQRGDTDRALDLFRQALDVYERSGHTTARANTLPQLAAIVARQGDLQQAMKLCQEAIAILEGTGDERGQAKALRQLAKIIARQGDNTRAVAILRDVLATYQRLGDTGGMANAMSSIAHLVAVEGDLAQAMTMYEASLQVNELLGDVSGQSVALFGLAGVAEQQGDTAKALALLRRSLDIGERTGDIHGRGITLQRIAATLAATEADPAQILEHLHRAHDLFERLGATEDRAAVLADIHRLEARSRPTEPAPS